MGFGSLKPMYGQLGKYIRRIVIKGLFFYELFNPLVQELTMRIWNLRGKPYPPPNKFKQQTVLCYARRFGIDTLIETGTYLGEMISAVRNSFKQIYTIELASDLYQRARRKFDKYQNVTLIHGDSAKMLPRLLDHIDQPCVFWLDAHFSRGLSTKGEVDTPIEQELEAILNHHTHPHVILIDDARDFNGTNYYPKLRDLRKELMTKRPSWIFEIKGNIIRFHPKCS
jgi:hypothetical protein